MSRNNRRRSDARHALPDNEQARAIPVLLDTLRSLSGQLRIIWISMRLPRPSLAQSAPNCWLTSKWHREVTICLCGSVPASRGPAGQLRCRLGPAGHQLFVELIFVETKRRLTVARLEAKSRGMLTPSRQVAQGGKVKERREIASIFILSHVPWSATGEFNTQEGASQAIQPIHQIAASTDREERCPPRFSGKDQSPWLFESCIGWRLGG